MISFLIGQPIIEKEYVTVMVGGVGYAVRVTANVQQQLSGAPEARLYIYTHVREEALELYGFTTLQEKELFLLLTDVSGVGPKTGLAILNMGTENIVTAVQEANDRFFAAVPRVGKKLAQKIIIDLRTKLGALRELDLGPVSEQRQEVQLALVSLGFDERSIFEAIKDLPVEEMNVPEAVKLAIQKMSGK